MGNAAASRDDLATVIPCPFVHTSNRTTLYDITSYKFLSSARVRSMFKNTAAVYVLCCGRFAELHGTICGR